MSIIEIVAINVPWLFVEHDWSSSNDNGKNIIQAIQPIIMIHPVLPSFISSNDTPRNIDTAIQNNSINKTFDRIKRILESNLQTKKLKFQKFYANNWINIVWDDDGPNGIFPSKSI